MKKLISLVLATLLILLTFASCSDKNELPKAEEPKSVALTDFAVEFDNVVKGYIVHSNAGEYTITEDDAYECTDDFYLYLPKKSVISSEKEFCFYTYIEDFSLNTNPMSGSGQTLNGFTPEMKAGEYTLSTTCYVRIVVKGSLSDVKIQVPEESGTAPLAGNKMTMALGPKITVVNDYLSTKGESVNYIFLTDTHNGSFVNDPDGDGLRNYDSVEDIAARLKAKRDIVAQAVTLTNNSQYIDFLVAGGDFINGYETTESSTYKAAKKSDPGLTVREHAIDQIQEILAPLKDCKKPVFVLAGNHDDNSGHSLWQSTNHPNDPRLYAEFLISDLDWEKEILSEFLNVEVVRDKSYSYGGKSISKYYYYDIEKNGNTTRVICLDYNDDRFPFDSSGRVTSTNGAGGAYCNLQMKWLGEVALVGDFDDCIMLSHAPCDTNSVLDRVITAYQNRSSFKNPGYGIDADFTSRSSGNITLYHHGHEHEDFVKYNSSQRCWTISTTTIGEYYDIVVSTPDSVYKYHMKNGENYELTRDGRQK